MDYTDYSIKRHYKEIELEERVTEIIERLQKAGRKHILVFTKFVDEARIVAENLNKL